MRTDKQRYHARERTVIQAEREFLCRAGEGGELQRGQDAAALCLSGGGIRSAAFCVGVLEALSDAREQPDAQAHEVVPEPGPDFDYLSTVSGGGFAGAWYVARAKRGRRQGTGKEVDDDGTGPNDLGRYLDPSDRHWPRGPLELLMAYLGKLLLFWLFLLPFLWSVLLVLAAIGAAGYAVARVALHLEWVLQSPDKALAALAVLSVVLVGALLLSRPGRIWFARGGSMALGSAASVLLLLVDLPPAANMVAIPGATVAAFIFGTLATRVDHLANVRWLSGLLGRARVVRVLAWICIGLVLVLLARLLVVSLPLFDWYYDLLPWRGEELTYGLLDLNPLLLTPLMLAFTFVLWFMPAAWSSVASIYRSRIERGFNLADATLEESAPIHLINVAASEDASHRGWDERQATSFAWSPHGFILHPEHGDIAGVELPTPPEDEDEALRLDYLREPIDYALAIGTSAAVAGPRMGSYTAKPIGLLLLLFNIRLGQWFLVGEPRPESIRGWLFERLPWLNRQKLMPFRARGCIGNVVLAELFGTRRGRPEWVHLTDGGHFDNLGLYEVVRRRCARVVVVDVGCDPEYRFSDLANAVRKIRVDFGVDVEIDGLRWTENGMVLDSPAGKRRQRVYGGSIRYPALEDASGLHVEGDEFTGEIVYIKAALIGDEPADVAGYADLHPAFPHESTTDQWFSESQYESYRRLGEYTVQSALERYEDAKAALSDPASEEEREKRREEQRDAAERSGTHRDARRLTARLREAGQIAGHPARQSTHGGAIVCRTRTADPSQPLEFLMVEATDGGVWVLPKGHIERGESPAACAARELEEEAGYVVRDDETQRRVVVSDRFTRGGQPLRCHYEAYRVQPAEEDPAPRKGKEPWLDPVQPADRMEVRREIWVTTGEYAWASRYGEEAKLEKVVPDAWARASGSVDLSDATRRMVDARMVIDELLWVLEEAERKIELISPPGRRDDETPAVDED